MKQNVLAREIQDRIVHYYYYQPEPIAKGQTMELLVDYGAVYENTRERKGYGRANMQGTLQSDSDEAENFKRNLVDRHAIRELIQSMKFMEIKTLVEVFENRIISPLIEITDSYLSNNSSPNNENGDKALTSQQRIPTKRQLVARFRVKWIADLFRKQIDVLKYKETNVDRDEARKLYNILSQRRLKTPDFTTADSENNESNTLSELQLTEQYGETYLLLSDGFGLFHPYDPTLWCETARILCKDLIRELSYLRKVGKQLYQMAEAIYKIATAAASSMQKSWAILTEDSNKQGITDACRVLGFQQTDNKVVVSHLTKELPDQSKTHSICLVQSGVTSDRGNERKTLHDMLDNICISLAPGSDRHQQLDSLVIRCLSTVTPAQSTDFVAVLTSAHTSIDREWYLLWQVIRVVHVISLHFMQSSNNFYSLKELCAKVGVNVKKAEQVLAAKMEEPFPSIYCNYDDEFIEEETSKDSVTLKKELSVRAPNNVYSQAHRDLRMLRDNEIIANYKENIKPNHQLRYDESDGSLPPGWRIERIKRRTSEHVDLYWYSKTNKKMRSRIEVGLFLKFVSECNGDEEAAWLKFPGSRKKHGKQISVEKSSN